MKVNTQSNLSFYQINKPGLCLKNNSSDKTKNLIEVCSADSANKSSIIDKFFQTKLGKFIKKVYCFGIDIDEIKD